MSYSLHLTVGMPLSGDGYPTFDEGGVLTLPDGRPFQPSQWRSVTVKPEAAPDLSDMGISAAPREQGAPMPQRGRGRRTTDYQRRP